MNKNVKNVMLEVVEEAVRSVGHFVKHNVKYVSTLVQLGTPYIMYFLGQRLVVERGYCAVGGELFVPVVLWTVANFIKNVAIKMNRGPHIPKPTERFTVVDEDGIVSVEQDRLEEMLIYMSDLEDYMERKGWL